MTNKENKPKVGDLVKMKFDSWWRVRSRARDYTHECGIVYGTHGHAIKVLMHDNSIRTGLIDHWEIIN